MKTTVRQQTFYKSEEDYEENCYLFSQSIQRQRIVSGKSYYVRSYFAGGQDFEKTVETLASKRANNKIAG